ncbi:MAG: arsenic resistance protein [Pseudomonadota bacterium]
MTSEISTLRVDPEPGEPEPEPGLAGGGVAALFVGAILAGSILGLTAPTAGETLAAGIDPTLLLMIFLLFFELRPGAIVQGFGNLRFLSLAWAANFLIVPFIGFALASLFLSGQPLLFIGLVIYFVAPCTDWFLGFTRMSRGDTALGSALIPINMLTQLLLFPLWLWLFARHTGLVDFAAIPGLLAQWFVLPLIAAQALRVCLVKLLPQGRFDHLLRVVGRIVPLAIAGLILQIFATNITAITGHLEFLALILPAVFLFFAATFIVGEGVSRLAGLSYPQHALLANTLAARNAPLMLAVTAVAIPDQPMILAALVMGMLVEFPHLTGLKQILLWQRSRPKSAPA